MNKNTFAVAISIQEAELILSIYNSATVSNNHNLIEKTKQDSTNLSKRLHRLFDDGYLVKAGHGVWGLSALGIRLGSFLEYWMNNSSEGRTKTIICAEEEK